MTGTETLQHAEGDHINHKVIWENLVSQANREELFSIMVQPLDAIDLTYQTLFNSEILVTNGEALEKLPLSYGFMRVLDEVEGSDLYSTVADMVDDLRNLGPQQPNQDYNLGEELKRILINQMNT